MLINEKSPLVASHHDVAQKRSINRIFDEFCVLVTNVRGEIEQGNSSSPEDVYFKFENFIKKSMALSLNSGENQGSFITETLGEAIYAMCAFADEVFLNMNWAGKVFWENHLLESAFFNTHISGEKIFHRIDILLAEGNAIYADLAEIYLKMLALGFNGRYRDIDHTIINNYRKKLYQFIVHSDDTAAIENGRLFDAEYSNSLMSVNRILMPDPGLWNNMIIAYLICFTVITLFLWYFDTTGIVNRMEEIEQIAIQGIEE